MEKKTKQIVWMTCQYCKKKSPDVDECVDAYAREICDKPEATHIACDKCDHEQRMDI